MDHDNEHLLRSITSMAAENESLKARLHECALIAANRQKTIQELKHQLDESAEWKSRLDEQITEMDELKKFIVATVAHIPETNSLQVMPDLKQQLQEQRKQFNILQTEISGLQAQLRETTMRNILLQQQADRVAELQILLSDALQERDEWKALASLKR